VDCESLSVLGHVLGLRAEKKLPKAGVWVWLGGCLPHALFRGTLVDVEVPASTQSASRDVELHVHVSKGRPPGRVSGEFGVLEDPPSSLVHAVEEG
jgi:hypothetical protein